MQICFGNGYAFEKIVWSVQDFPCYLEFQTESVANLWFGNAECNHIAIINLSVCWKAFQIAELIILTPCSHLAAELLDEGICLKFARQSNQKSSS